MFLDGHYFNYIAINDVLLLESLDLSSFFLLASSERWTFTGHSRLLRSAGPDEATRQPRRRTKVALLVRAQGERKEGRKEGRGGVRRKLAQLLVLFIGPFFRPFV